MIAAMVHQLTREMTMEEIKAAGFDKYFVDHTNGVFLSLLQAFPLLCHISGSKAIPLPISVKIWLRSKRQESLTTISCVSSMIRIFWIPFVSSENANRPYQRFGESLRIVQDNLDAKIFMPSILPLTNKQTKKPLLFLGAVLYFRSYQLCVSK